MMVGTGLSYTAVLRCLPLFGSQQLGHNLVNHPVHERTDLFGQLGLNRMGNQDWLVPGETQSGTLGVGGGQKLGGCNISGRNSVFFKTHDIVRTARNAGSSIAEGFNDRVAPLLQLLFDLNRNGSARGDFAAA